MATATTTRTVARRPARARRTTHAFTVGLTQLPGGDDFFWGQI